MALSWKWETGSAPLGVEGAPLLGAALLWSLASVNQVLVPLGAQDNSVAFRPVAHGAMRFGGDGVVRVVFGASVCLTRPLAARRMRCSVQGF